MVCVLPLVGQLRRLYLHLELAAETAEAFAQDRPGYYPPALTGMRGSTDGSYEAAHALRDGNFWKKAGQPKSIDEVYDLIVVGGGLSGLAAAYFYRQQNPSARILILENHDDFGGHAKRNEFRPGGRLLLANGGTWAIESPFPYSKEAARLMADLQIDPAALAEKCDVKDGYKNLQSAYFFDKETPNANFAINFIVCWVRAVSIRPGTSMPSPLIAGRTVMPMNTIRCSIRIGRRANRLAKLDAKHLAESLLPTLTPPLRLTRIKGWTRLIEPSTNWREFPDNYSVRRFARDGRPN